jgi:hypothetical protein
VTTAILADGSKLQWTTLTEPQVWNAGLTTIDTPQGRVRVTTPVIVQEVQLKLP